MSRMIPRSGFASVAGDVLLLTRMERFVYGACMIGTYTVGSGASESAELRTSPTTPTI